MVEIWDLRTGGIFETLKYDHAVTSLQFDSRKVVAATGENGIKVGLIIVSSSSPLLICSDRFITVPVCNIPHC